MKKSDKKFIPFVHENLEIKNELLEMARKARSCKEDNCLEMQLASILIYTTITEYLAENILETLTHLVREGTYTYFAGVLCIETIRSQDDRKMTLGDAIKQIKKFSFPDKNNIIGCFSVILRSRNSIFHNFAKSDLDCITKFVKDDLPTIQDKCEELIKRINTIYMGLQKILSPELISSSEVPTIE